MIYNFPKTKEEHEFVSANRMGLEWTRRVKGGKKFSSNGDLARVAGDGQFGFTTKRPFVNITTGKDGQYIKSRKTVCRKRKNVCRLATNEQIKKGAIMSDTLRAEEINQRFEEEKKLQSRKIRKMNRNPGSRKGIKRSKKC